jgi:hypothetical protein
MKFVHVYDSQRIPTRHMTLQKQGDPDSEVTEHKLVLRSDHSSFVSEMRHNGFVSNSLPATPSGSTVFLIIHFCTYLGT